jgi:O-methyltransferase involved in polyketide biosynthesis
MRDAGCRSDAKTFFICEGVTHYLSASAADSVFRYVARSATGSQMVFTYIHRGILDSSATFVGAANTLATVRRAGEPYTFGFDPHFRFEKLNRPGHNRSTPAENAGPWGASLVRRASSSG